MQHIESFYLFESIVEMYPGIEETIEKLTNLLWKNKLKYSKTQIVTQIPIKTLDGVDGLVRVEIEKKLHDCWATIDTEPLYSRDPMDFVLKICPINLFERRQDLFYILYHEFLHAVDPLMSTQFNLKKQISYKDWSDPDYYGHSLEYLTISNVFFKFLYKKFKNSRKNKEQLNSILDDITEYFTKHKKLKKETKDFLEDQLISLDKLSEYSPFWRRFLSTFYKLRLKIKEEIS